MSFTPTSLELLKALGLGFAFSGLLASVYQLIADRPVSFSLLQQGGIEAILSIPILIFTAPAIILHDTIRGRRLDRRPVAAVVLATVIAGFWSMLCGRLVLDAALLLVPA
ncbi:hypothetical protein [Enterovirga sp.]|jgi:hypothetical protein|uniref:DUF6949 family protein n=1 Tax=Enterovirga sp. TaxID=2026350 RepID=UPI00261AEB9F|nr:hypothetical protein [Enterovirga sp.]MDB5592781.1 hypothetical protein [Enterovirga sp.]